MRTVRSDGLMYVLNHYSPGSSSHFSHIFPLLNELRTQGLPVALLIEKGRSRPDVLDSDVPVYFLPDRSGIGRMFALARFCRLAASAGYTRIFVRISAWSAFAAIVATRFTRTRVAFWLSGTTIGFDRSQPLSVNKIRWWLRSRLPYLLATRFTDRFVTGPEPMAEYYSTTGGVDPKKVRVLYNDVTVARYELTASERDRARRILRSHLNLPDDAKILLLIHRLSPVRRTNMYLAQVVLKLSERKDLHDWVIVVAGDGGELPLVRTTLNEGLGPSRVRVLGSVPSEETLPLYAGADIFIQPSHAEGFPRVLLEAMASGLPVVSTDAGGSRAVLGPIQQAFVTPIDRPEEFASALVELCAARESRRSALAGENTMVVQAFDTAVVALMYRKVLFDETG